MIMCFGLVIMWCQLQTTAPADSYCLTYQKVVQAKGDGEIKGKLAVKQRILANELVFKKHCEGTGK